MVAGGAIMSVSNEREVRGMKESIEVKDIIKKKLIRMYHF
jgi:hypothetical protein